MKKEVKNQKTTEQYAVYNGDCIDLMKGVEAESIGLSIYSPPFFSTCTHIPTTQRTYQIARTTKASSSTLDFWLKNTTGL